MSNEKVVVTHMGIEITVTKAHSTSQNYTVYFRNAPLSFQPLHGVEPLKGFSSMEEGVEAGKKFVDEHQWEYVETIFIYELSVRHWWDGDWGYGAHVGGSGKNNSGYKTKNEAIEAGRKYIQEEIEKFEIEHKK